MDSNEHQQRDTSGVPFPAWAYPQEQWCKETGEDVEVHASSVARALAGGKPVPDFNRLDNKPQGASRMGM
jgi:hypothetical protein